MIKTDVLSAFFKTKYSRAGSAPPPTESTPPEEPRLGPVPACPGFCLKTCRSSREGSSTRSARGPARGARGPVASAALLLGETGGGSVAAQVTAATSGCHLGASRVPFPGIRKRRDRMHTSRLSICFSHRRINMSSVNSGRKRSWRVQLLPATSLESHVRLRGYCLFRMFDWAEDDVLASVRR